MNFSAFFKKLFSKKKKEPPKKLALALGSGGAKGFAHLGVLKALEEEGISFQVVTGTSAGSIVGALYAKGYSATDIRQLIKTVALKEVVKFLRVRMDMTPIENILNRYLGESDFSDLKIPFACWATNEDTNEGVLLNSGNVAKACCASSAIPPFFASVLVGKSYLADGAFTNALPADAARELGGDVVIGVDLSPTTEDVEEEKGSFRALVKKYFSSSIPEKELPNARTRGRESSDLVITPPLKGHHATDLSSSAWEEMIEAGYEETKRRMNEIKTLLNEKGIPFGERK